MKKLLPLLLVPSFAMVSNVPAEIKDAMDSICKYIANGDSIREAACVEVMVITYKEGYKTAIEDSKK